MRNGFLVLSWAVGSIFWAGYAQAIEPAGVRPGFSGWSWGPFSGVEQKAARYHRSYVRGRELHASQVGRKPDLLEVAVKFAPNLDEPQHVDGLGPAGFYFLTLPSCVIEKMTVVYPSGKTGLIEPTLQGDRLRVRLEKGLNRIDLEIVTAGGRPQDDSGKQTKNPETRQFLLIWDGT